MLAGMGHPWTVRREPGAEEQVRLAQAGDPAGLNAVLARHRADMFAVALAILRRPEDAEDAVQDAMLVALTKLSELKDPQAVGPWLKMVVRNCCRMHLRARHPVPVGVPAMTGSEPDPVEALERHAARDWVWHAVEQLSPPLRVVTLLRYFSGITHYEQIAAICGVPVGTVRSRLSKARALLIQRLLSTADAGHSDIAELTAARRREAEQTLFTGQFEQILKDTWHPEVETLWSDGRRMRGTAHLVGVLERSEQARVQQRLTGVTASRDIVIWEMDVLNPPDDPAHCPPSAAWLMFLEAGRVRRFHLLHGQAA
jgi:RNA polymerase sigma factor (sigma-70 family)